jgi:hypothetical protein
MIETYQVEEEGYPYCRNNCIISGDAEGMMNQVEDRRTGSRNRAEDQVAWEVEVCGR